MRWRTSSLGLLGLLLARCSGGGPTADSRVDAPPSTERRLADAKPVEPVALTAEMLIKACTIIVSCMPEKALVHDCLQAFFGGPPRYPGEVQRGGRGSEQVFACLARSSGCSGLPTCLGYWMTVGPPCTATSPKGGKCASPSTLFACEQASAFYLDCQALYGVPCQAAGNDEACTSGVVCTGSSSWCKGPVVARCFNGFEIHDDRGMCPRQGLTCNDGKCTGPGAPCVATACRGNRAVFCVEGRERSVDCSGLGAGFTCVSDADGTRCRQGTECDEQSSGLCQGDRLPVCSGGKLESVDCKALGFARCDIARCVP